MPGLFVSCYATFGLYLWKACSFLKGNGGGMDLGEGKGKLGGREIWKEGGRDVAVGLYQK